MHRLYRVGFYKMLVDSTGHPVDACQGVVETRAPDRESAIKNGRQTFARLRKIGDWSLHADYEIVKAVPARKRASAAAWSDHLKTPRSVIAIDRCGTRRRGDRHRWN